MAQTDRQTYIHKDGHGDSITKSAQWGRFSKDMNQLLEYIAYIAYIAVKCYVESSIIDVDICWNCSEVFYGKKDLIIHTKLEIQCSICKNCMAVESFEFDYYEAMEHL